MTGVNREDGAERLPLAEPLEYGPAPAPESERLVLDASDNEHLPVIDDGKGIQAHA